MENATASNPIPNAIRLYCDLFGQFDLTEFTPEQLLEITAHLVPLLYNVFGRELETSNREFEGVSALP